MEGDVVEAGRPKAARGEGYPLTTGKGSGEGAVPPPQKFFSILDLKMASLGALWVPVGGCIPLILPLRSATESMDISLKKDNGKRLVTSVMY